MSLSHIFFDVHVTLSFLDWCSCHFVIFGLMMIDWLIDWWCYCHAMKVMFMSMTCHEIYVHVHVISCHWFSCAWHMPLHFWLMYMYLSFGLILSYFVLSFNQDYFACIQNPDVEGSSSAGKEWDSWNSAHTPNTVCPALTRDEVFPAHTKQKESVST